EKGFEGRTAGKVPEKLRRAVVKAVSTSREPLPLALGLRLGDDASVREAAVLIANEKAAVQPRLTCIRIFGETQHEAGLDVLLEAVRKSASGPVRREALAALVSYPDAQVAKTVLSLYPAKLPEADGVRAAALNLLASRPAWSLLLLKAIDEKK